MMKSANGSNLSEPVYEHLIEMILSLQLKPGEKVPEAKIAKQFGISRTPIREALRKLSNDGLIRIYPNRYAEVVTYDDEYIRHVGELRIAIDQMAIKLAIHYGSNADFLKLSQFADQCSQAAKEGNLAERIKADIEFHMELARISQNQLIQKVQKELSLQIEFILACKYINVDDSFMKSQAHYEIIDALIARDEERAVRTAAKHLVEFYSFDDTYPADFFLKH
jgi:DNA-binding GntR family transcriptional regulator